MIPNGQLVRTTRDSVSPARASRLPYSACVRSEATPTDRYREALRLAEQYELRPLAEACGAARTTLSWNAATR